MFLTLQDWVGGAIQFFWLIDWFFSQPRLSPHLPHILTTDRFGAIDVVPRQLSIDHKIHVRDPEWLTVNGNFTFLRFTSYFCTSLVYAMLRPASRWGKETWPDLRLKMTPSRRRSTWAHPTRLDLTAACRLQSTSNDLRRSEVVMNLREHCTYTLG